jgi:viologen exporter family transport system ATP-binding protein
VPLVQASGLTKVYRRPDKGPGIVGAVRHVLTRRYVEHVAVDHIELAIGAGESVGFVGPNGAGKSTTVKLLSGILVPTAGEVSIDGIVPWRDRRAVARRIGVLFGQRTQLWWDLPVRDSLAALRDIYGVDRATYQRRLERLDEVLGIGEILPMVGRRLSLGQRMRADLAATLVHGPQVVYLDEPTIGLDIAVKDRVCAFLRELRDEGTTVMLTSHDLSDIEGVCRRLVIIDDGRIIFDGDLTALKDRYARDRLLHLETATPVCLGSLRAALPEVTITEGDTPLRCSVRFDRFAMTAGTVVAALTPLAELVDFRVDEPAIEDIIRRVYSGELRVSQPSGPPRVPAAAGDAP